MAKLLHIVSSPRGDRSASITVASYFINSYLASHPGDTVETLDLWHAGLPEFDGPTIEAKYSVMHGQSPTGDQEVAWRVVTRIADGFKAADKYLFSLPMWNFGIPYKLKQYIDILVQPGLTFTYSPDAGYKGLVTGKPVVAIYARGGAYGPGTGMEAYDSQSPYLRGVLGFIGFSEIKEIFVEPTAAKSDAVEAGNKQAGELAVTF